MLDEADKEPLEFMAISNRIFLAHASEDKERILRLYADLKVRGFEPWLDSEDLIPGLPWKEQIQTAIRDAHVFLACLSSRSVSKVGYVQNEFRLALSAYGERPPGSVFLIPVRLDGCEMPNLQISDRGLSLCDLHWVDLWEDKGFERLAAALTFAVHGDPSSENDQKKIYTTIKEKNIPSHELKKPPIIAAEKIQTPDDKLFGKNDHENPKYLREKSATYQADIGKPWFNFQINLKRFRMSISIMSLMIVVVSLSMIDPMWMRSERDGSIILDGPEAIPEPDAIPEPEAIPGAEPRSTVDIGETFRDCDFCPEMLVVPWGTFTMGSPGGEAGRWPHEGPQHVRMIAEPFALGKYEVTFAEWDACVKARGCDGYRPDDEGWGRGRRPVVNVSWNDAQAYVDWLSAETGQTYRLPSEAEWEYAARAGTTSPFYFGSTISTDQANYNGNHTYGSAHKGEYRERTVPVGYLRSNAFGLHEMHGNAKEWVEDCWSESYEGVWPNGSAWTRGNCGARVLRGGSWSDPPVFLRSAYRARHRPDVRFNDFGFRVARTLR